MNKNNYTEIKELVIVIVIITILFALFYMLGPYIENHAYPDWFETIPHNYPGIKIDTIKETNTNTTRTFFNTVMQLETVANWYCLCRKNGFFT